jgi:pimeloyl-ACP methyl ester carboxylesterase
VELRERDGIRWRVTGDGPPLVCVHGLAGSWRWWRPVLPKLAEAHEVHLVDLPRRPLRDTADWLSGWLDANGFGDAAVAGHSLGGLLAAQLATRRRLEKLVLVDPAGVPTGWNLPREFVSLGFELLATTPRFLPLLAADALRWGPLRLLQGALYATRTNVALDLSRIQTPTLVVWGERDSLLPVRLADAWRDALPAARLVVIPRAGHVPMVDAPDELSDALLEFLADESGDATGSGVMRSVGDARHDGEPPVR